MKKRRNSKPVGLAEPTVVRVAGYARCSTEEQSARTDFNTLDNQKGLIGQHVALKEATGEPWKLAGFYVDDGFSGKNMERPELRRLMVDIQSGCIDVVVVYKLDRITRSLSDFFEMDRMLEANGCSLVSINENLDTSTPMGKAMRNIMIIFAELERETNSERVRDKMMAEARQGRFLGGNIPYGLRVENRKYLIVPEEAKVVRLMFEKYTETRSVSRVRDSIMGLGYRNRRGGKFTSQAIEKILGNVRYRGTYAYNGVEIPDTHEAIVSPEVFETVQQTVTMYHRKPPTDSGEAMAGHNYLLQGLLECPHCDVLMTPQSVHHNRGHKRNKGYTPYYECGRPHKRIGEKCPVGRYNAESLEESILDELESLITEPERLEQIMASLEATEDNAAVRERLEELREAMKPIRKQIDNIVQAISNGADFTSLAARLKEFENQDRELKTEAVMLEAVLNRERTHVFTVEDARRWFREVREVLREGGPEERKVVMRGLVRKVEALDKETARVEFNILPAPPEANHDDHGSSYLQRWLPGVDSNHEPSG